MKQRTITLLILFALLLSMSGVVLPQDTPPVELARVVDDFERGLPLAEDDSGTAIGYDPWGDTAENVQLAAAQLISDAALALPIHADTANTVLAVHYDIASWGGFSHVFNDGSKWTTADWRPYNALSFWLYGNDTGGTIQVEIFDNRNPDRSGDTAERFYYRILDNYTGWQQFTIPFELFQRRTDFQPDGAPDDGLGLDAVSGYAMGFPVGTGPQTAYVDDVGLAQLDNTSAVIISSGAAMTEDTVMIDSTITWDSRDWNLLWSDEFDGEAGTPPNPDNWNYDLGGSGWGNNELEFYTDSTDNASLDGSGNLAIVAREDDTGERACHYGTCRYTSARLLTWHKFAFTYGRVEARIKIPRGQGIWPAFWMLGTNIGQIGWPKSGEIDIMENIGREPQTVHGTVHGPGYSGADGIGRPYAINQDFADDFHVYAIDWDPDSIRWYVDGNLYNVFTPKDLGSREWVYDHDFFILLNVAVGGYWPGNPDDTTEFPQTMLVDYVRVYQLADGS